MDVLRGTKKCGSHRVSALQNVVVLRSDPSKDARVVWEAGLVARLVDSVLCVFSFRRWEGEEEDFGLFFWSDKLRENRSTRSLPAPAPAQQEGGGGQKCESDRVSGSPNEVASRTPLLWFDPLKDARDGGNSTGGASGWPRQVL